MNGHREEPRSLRQPGRGHRLQRGEETAEERRPAAAGHAAFVGLHRHHGSVRLAQRVSKDGRPHCRPSCFETAAGRPLSMAGMECARFSIHVIASAAKQSSLIAAKRDCLESQPDLAVWNRAETAGFFRRVWLKKVYSNVGLPDLHSSSDKPVQRSYPARPRNSANPWARLVPTNS